LPLCTTNCTRRPEVWQLEYLQVSSGTSAIPTATLRLLVHGEQREGAALAGDPARLVRYDIHAVTTGTEAMGEVTVQLEKGERRVLGRCLHRRD
jgi:2-isopropylmalate synthase